MPLPPGTYPIGGAIVSTLAARPAASPALRDANVLLPDPVDGGWLQVNAAGDDWEPASDLPAGTSRLDRLLWNDSLAAWEPHSETEWALSVLTPDGPDTDDGRRQLRAAIEARLASGSYRGVSAQNVGREYAYSAGTGISESGSTGYLTSVWPRGGANPFLWYVTPNHLDRVGYYQGGDASTPLISSYTFSYWHRNSLRGNISIRIAAAGTSSADMKALFDAETEAQRTEIVVYERDFRVVGGRGSVAGEITIHDNSLIPDADRCRVAVRFDPALVRANRYPAVRFGNWLFADIQAGDNIHVDRHGAAEAEGGYPGYSGGPARTAEHYRAGDISVSFNNVPSVSPVQPTIGVAEGTIRRNFLKIGGVAYDVLVAQISGDRPDDPADRLSTSTWASARFDRTTPPQFLDIEIPAV